MVRLSRGLWHALDVGASELPLAERECFVRYAPQEMNEKKQKELGRTSLKKYNKNPRMEIQKIENLNKPLALINQFCKDVGIKISIAAEGASALAPAPAPAPAPPRGCLCVRRT